MVFAQKNPYWYKLWLLNVNLCFKPQIFIDLAVFVKQTLDIVTTLVFECVFIKGTSFMVIWTLFAIVVNLAIWILNFRPFSHISYNVFSISTKV